MFFDRVPFATTFKAIFLALYFLRHFKICRKFAAEIKRFKFSKEIF
jgi:hypothetical protein